MGSALEYLVGLRDAEGRFDIPPAEVLPLQIEAANERLETRVAQIPLLKNRAEAAGISTISAPGDLVPLLFAHNTYKTYSEPWLVEGQYNIQVDPARIAYGVMTGIGFLGAGAIIKHFNGVRGLTTAAGLWCVAAIGLACGLGLYIVSIMAAGW